jgi:2-alkyl-3-oxoalkanoate reductase
MKIFLAGSTGVVGRHLLPLLVENKHDVVALIHTPQKGRIVEELGARPIVADVFKKDELFQAIQKTKPEIIIHQLTSLTSAGNFKKFDQEFALTNRFRTEVIDTMLEAARSSQARRFIAQSFCGWPYERKGGLVKTETDPLDPEPPKSFSKSLAAIRHLEQAVTTAANIEGFVMRYGIFYGPGTGISKDGAIVKTVQSRKLPIVGNGNGHWSFVHMKDVARATLAAITNGSPGIYNIVDDEPAPVKTWLPYLAEAVQAKPPRKLPVWLARLFIGDGGVSMMTKIRGGSNQKAKRELGWQPFYKSWRQGFLDGL